MLSQKFSFVKQITMLIALLIFGVVAVGTLPGNTSAVYAQKKDRREEKKKDTPGPLPVKEKGKQDKPKDPPPKKKPN